jgi:hypothetical protein
MEAAMADYFTPTVIQPDIPIADMTPLERLILRRFFESEEHEGALYLFSETGPCDLLYFRVSDLRHATEASEGVPSCLFEPALAALDAAGPEAGDAAFDFSAMSYERILQDIVKRSQTLRYISVTAAMTCSKMRPDGFGGFVTLITEDNIIGESTTGLLEKWLGDASP